MKALILNSGLGTRMGVLTSEHPKCMSEISPRDTILSRQLRQLCDVGVTEAVITTGLFDQVLMDYVRSLDLPLAITFVHNPLFRETNYIYSIYCAREYLADDILLMHGDLVFENAALDAVLAAEGSCMAVSSTVPLPQKDFKAVIEDGKMIGRGTADMKSGLMASIMAVKLLQDAGYKLPGDVTITSVCDEEGGGNGSIQAVMRGLKADGVVNCEPTGDEAILAHMGWVFFKVEFEGKSCHSGAKNKGVSAIDKAIKVIGALNEREHEWLLNYRHPLCPPPNLNIGVIEGGTAGSTVPGYCSFSTCVHFVPTLMTQEQVIEEFNDVVERTAKADPWMSEHPPKITIFQRGRAFEMEREDPFVDAFRRSYAKARGKELAVVGNLVSCRRRSVLSPYSHLGNASLNEYRETGFYSLLNGHSHHELVYIPNPRNGRRHIAHLPELRRSFLREVENNILFLNIDRLSHAVAVYVILLYEVADRAVKGIVFNAAYNLIACLFRVRSASIQLVNLYHLELKRNKAVAGVPLYEKDPAVNLLALDRHPYDLIQALGSGYIAIPFLAPPFPRPLNLFVKLRFLGLCLNGKAAPDYIPLESSYYGVHNVGISFKVSRPCFYLIPAVTVRKLCALVSHSPVLIRAVVVSGIVILQGFVCLSVRFPAVSRFRGKRSDYAVNQSHAFTSHQRPLHSNHQASPLCSRLLPEP